MNRTLDWVSEHDERSRNYGISDVLTSSFTRKFKYWGTGSTLDQGREGACVGFAWTAELLASPMPSLIDSGRGNEYAQGIYRRAKQIDAWEGENYEGTSVLAGAKAITERGHIDSYRWCFNIDEVRNAVLQEGPVIIGIPWFDGMYETRPGGLVEVSGRLVGGHALLLTGYSPYARLPEEGWHKRFDGFRWKNSWGVEYGKKGGGFIKTEDLARLLADRGEACVPMGRKRVRL